MRPRRGAARRERRRTLPRRGTTARRWRPPSPAAPLRRLAPSPRQTPARAVPALDGGVVATTALLVSLGVVMVYSATAPLAIGSALPPQFVRHLAAVGLAVPVVAVALRIPVAVWRRLSLPLWVASALLLGATLLVGVEANGARRWLPIGGLSFQPAEIAKWATLLAVAGVLSCDTRRRVGAPALRAALALVAVPVALLLLQPDLGNAALLVALSGLLLFAAGTPLRLLAAPALAAAVALAGYVALRPYALARWRGFLEPWQTKQAEGFQLVQSFVAFGRGGSFGVGLGDGLQKLSYLPEAHTDFILSVVAEELGLAGVLVVLGGFAAFAVAGLRIARRARSSHTMLVALAMTALVAVPAAVNAAVVMGLLPTTGFTLPFLSFGSNSLLVCALAVGILLRVASRESTARSAPVVVRRRRAHG